MKSCAVMFAVFSLATATIGAPSAAHAQAETIKPLNVRPADMVTPVAFYYVSTPVRGASQQANDALPIDPFAAPAPSAPTVPPASPGFFPTDMTNPGNQPGLAASQHHPVYVNQPPSHWGYPAALLRDLGVSEIIHVLDQYTGSTANNRYTLGTSYQLTYTIPADHTLRLADLAAMVHAAATAGGSGTGQLYHLFIPQGVDVCTRPGNCYTPDNPATWTACAWHSEFNFYDLGPVIFTVEPYQNNVGCRTNPDRPVNGVLADSTDMVLSHEVFEAISDPMLSGWVGRNTLIGAGQEIADMCDLSVLSSDGNYYASSTPVTLGSNKYVVTAIYSNAIHACTFGEGGPTW